MFSTKLTCKAIFFKHISWGYVITRRPQYAEYYWIWLSLEIHIEKPLAQEMSNSLALSVVSLFPFLASRISSGHFFFLTIFFREEATKRKLFVGYILGCMEKV